MTLFLTQIRIAGLAELPSSAKTEIEWQLIRFAQLASILDGCESILGVIKSHKPIVIPVRGKGKKKTKKLYFCIQWFHRAKRPYI